MSHPFFSDIKIQDILEKKVEAPFKPKLSTNVLDVSNFDQQFTSEEAVNSVIPANKLAQIKKFQDQFDGFA